MWLEGRKKEESDIRWSWRNLDPPRPRRHVDELDSILRPTGTNEKFSK